jgi:hypothetical protein
MPGIQLTGKPSNAAAGGTSFNEAMLRAGISGGDTGAPGLSASGLQSGFSYATASVRLLGSAARETATALNQLQAKINTIRPAGGGSGGGVRYSAGSAAAGGSLSAYGYVNARHENLFDQARRTRAQNRLRMTGHMIDRLGSHGGVGELTRIAGMTMESPAIWPAVAAGAIAFSPQIMALAFNGFMGATSPYRNFAMGAYGMARAGGFNGDRFISNLSDNGSTTGGVMSKRLRAVGLGSTDAMSIMQRYGITPTSAQDFVGGATALSRMSLDSNLGSMDQGQLIAVQRMLVGGGMGAINTNAAAMSDFLSNATSRGLDKSVMIQSMQNSLTTVASGGGLGANVADAIGFNRGIFSNNNFAARSGAASSSLSAGLNSSLSNPFSSAPKAMALFTAAASIHNVGDLERVIGHSAYAALETKGNLAGQMEVQGFLNSTSPAARTAYLSDMLKGNPNAALRVYQGYVQRFTGDPALQSIGVSHLANASLGDTLNGLAGLVNGSGAFIPGMESEYAIKLRSLGVPASQIPTLIAAGKSVGVSPVMMAAQEYKESSFGTNPASQVYRAGGHNGPFQMGAREFGTYGRGSVMNFRDAAYAAARMDAANGMAQDPAYALAAWREGPGYANNPDTLSTANAYAQSALAFISGGSATAAAPISGAQQTQLNMFADNSNAGLNGAKATFFELKGSVDDLARAAAALQGAVTQLIGAATGGAAGRPTGRVPAMQSNPYGP